VKARTHLRRYKEARPPHAVTSPTTFPNRAPRTSQTDARGPHRYRRNRLRSRRTRHLRRPLVDQELSGPAEVAWGGRECPHRALLRVGGAVTTLPGALVSIHPPHLHLPSSSLNQAGVEPPLDPPHALPPSRRPPSPSQTRRRRSSNQPTNGPHRCTQTNPSANPPRQRTALSKNSA